MHCVRDRSLKRKLVILFDPNSSILSFANPALPDFCLLFFTTNKMPLGWYLAQGLIPLGESSSDDEEGPCELPDGRLVCGPHGRVVCGRCCSDYSFMDEVLNGDNEDEDEDEDEDSLDPRTMELYLNLSPEARAQIDSRFGGPPHARAARPPNRGTANFLPFHIHEVDDDEGDEDDDEMDSLPDLEEASPPSTGMPSAVRGTGRVFPTRFIPPSTEIKPIELFSGTRAAAYYPRYLCRDDPQKVLILTDGACLNNGQPNPEAGWAFVFGPGSGNGPAIVSSRLEKEGPFGDPAAQTSNRAELRAVIAALQFRAWAGEGFKTVVIATDSEYVTRGSIVWAKTWIKNGWRKGDGSEVKNKDLWESLLGEVERHHDEGVSIQFWRIPREWNTVADEAAKKGAEQPAIEKFARIFGALC
ncbi:ribonuclease H-like domain-containing protein [Nemania sp. FL0031]|nr:ribonuclease H-like domain-containing protein [Nemania sp. FL0031]